MCLRYANPLAETKHKQGVIHFAMGLKKIKRAKGFLQDQEQNFYPTVITLFFLICKVFLKKYKAPVTKEFKNWLDRWMVARLGQFSLENSLKILSQGRLYRKIIIMTYLMKTLIRLARWLSM